MKKIFTLMVIVCSLFSNAKAQFVLNEVYGDPGAGAQEYFELYNTSTSNTPISMDGVSIVSYFEEGTKKGFYVMDMPDLFVGPKGFFVGAAANPFNFQGTNNFTANFNWNDPNLLAMGGYIKKWVWDGNKAYTEAAVPAQFNDFFNVVTGGGSSKYSIFVLLNGVAVNTLFFGSSTPPDYLLTMPTLKTSYLINGVEKSFSINFSNYKSKGAEFVPSNAGTNNGFIRSKDGLCGSWLKSSSAAETTPGTSNGPAAGAAGSLTINAQITRGTYLSDTSSISYAITAGPASAFSVELQLYIDNGSVANQLDSDDQLFKTTTVNAVNANPTVNYFTPGGANILIVAKASAGCLDQVLLVKDALKQQIVLPVNVISFKGNLTNSNVLLQWSVIDNETGNYFEMEKSTNGQTYNTIGLIFTTEKPGTENYLFKDPTAIKTTTLYRVKIYNKNGKVTYSKVLMIKPEQNNTTNALSLVQNPVNSSLAFTIKAAYAGISHVTIYNANGVKVYTANISMQSGVNAINLSLDNKFNSGSYFLEVNNNTQRSTVQFIKL